MEKSERILVVDDEKGICQNVEKILSKSRFEVTKAMSAEEALKEMAKGGFSLLISDMVMPGTNGLELLKLVKQQWPVTKVLMMTAYASIETAVKAIRLGALDYIPKPFTPDELRRAVEKALAGELREAEVSVKEKESIKVIDIDVPFDQAEVAKSVGEGYADRIGPSDMPAAAAPAPQTLEGYCLVGSRVCDIFKKLSATCKAGVKTHECPQNKAKAKKAGAGGKAFDAKELIGIDQPFSYREVIAVTGPEYVEHMRDEGFAFVPYAKLKANVAKIMAERKEIDLDVPYARKAVAESAGEAYADRLGPSDMPAAVAAAPADLEGYCLVGSRVCDIFKKLGATCKAGVKTAECPQNKAKGKKAAKGTAFDARKLIGIDQPFEYDAVAAVTGPEYLARLQHEGTAVVPYAELKKNVAAMLKEAPRAARQASVEKVAAERRILVIDDETAVNNNIRKILFKKGYQVDQAMTKAEALEKINAGRYHLVLLDLRMPGVDGLELLRTVRERRPEAMVIIITGYASLETAVEAARIGAIDYLPKPFTPAEIRGATEKALRLAA